VNWLRAAADSAIRWQCARKYGIELLTSSHHVELIARLDGYGDSMLSSFASKWFRLTVKHEGEAVRHEKTLTGGLDPPVVHFYQMRFL
jgi:hypothetical protein